MTVVRHTVVRLPHRAGPATSLKNQRRASWNIARLESLIRQTA